MDDAVLGHYQGVRPLQVTLHLGPLPCSSAARSRLGSSDGSGGSATPSSPSVSFTRPAQRQMYLRFSHLLVQALVRQF